MTLINLFKGVLLKNEIGLTKLRIGICALNLLIDRETYQDIERSHQYTFNANPYSVGAFSLLFQPTPV